MNKKDVNEVSNQKKSIISEIPGGSTERNDSVDIKDDKNRSVADHQDRMGYKASTVRPRLEQSRNLDQESSTYKD